jgi:hypothetical protein
MITDTFALTTISRTVPVVVPLITTAAISEFIVFRTVEIAIHSSRKQLCPVYSQCDAEAMS